MKSKRLTCRTILFLLTITSSLIQISSQLELKIGILIPYTEFSETQQISQMIHQVSYNFLRQYNQNKNNNNNGSSLEDQSKALDWGSFIPGLTNVTFFERDTKYARADALRGARFVEGNRVNAVIGHIGSSASEVLTLFFTSSQIPSCSGGSTSPILSNKREFPFFFRTIPSDTLQGKALCDLIYNLGWRRFAIFAKADTYGQGLSSVALSYGTSIGLEVVSSQLHPLSQTSFKDQLRVIKQSNAKIIFLPQSSETELILQDAMELEMIGKEYVYLITEPVLVIQRMISKNLTHLLQGIITSKPTISPGKVNQDYRKDWIDYNNQVNPGKTPAPVSDYALFSFDCLYLLLNGFKNLLENNAGNPNITLENLVDNKLGEYLTAKELSKKVDIEGTTGNLLMNEDGDRVGDILFQNYAGGKLVEVGKWVNGKISITQEIFFYDETTTIPLDRNPPKAEFYMRYDDSASIFILILTVIVIIFCVFLFIGLTIHKENQVIKGSSYLFCILMVVGSLIGSLTIFTLIGKPNPYSCMARPWIMSLSYALVFCNLVGKTYRIHKIFNNKSFQIIDFTNTHLLVIASITVIIEIVILMVWSIVDPLVPYSDTESNPFFTIIKCRSNNITTQNIFVWLLISINLIIAIVGAYFAYRTRRIDENYKESKYIGMALYNVLILSVVFLSILNSGNATNELAKFIILSLGILMICFFTLSFIFIPKFVDIFVFKRGVDSSRNESNTPKANSNKNQHQIVENNNVNNQRVTQAKSQSIINEEPSRLEIALKELTT